MNISMTKTTHPGKLPPADRLGFGSVFTDHMFLMNYTDREGWHNARIVPFGPISISPAASVLHYGTEVFEGLKAYRRPDGAVQLFRPWENVARLNRSCDRLGLPRIDERDGLQAIRELVKMDAAWVPSAPGTSLYIRPFLYSTDPTLALHGVHEATFAIILSPSGSYFSDGLKPVPIMVETEDVRAVRGGTGEAKCGGNYAAANRAGDKALEKGYSQVLWLDGVERKYVEEGGGMNVMFKIAGTVVTPMLTGAGAFRSRSGCSAWTSCSRLPKTARWRKRGASAPQPSFRPSGSWHGTKKRSRSTRTGSARCHRDSTTS